MSNGRPWCHEYKREQEWCDFDPKLGRVDGGFMGHTCKPPAEIAKRVEFGELIDRELKRAYQKHGREPWSRHEFYAILLEEVEELWADIKRDAPHADLNKELVQVAAMCVRYWETSASVAPPAPEQT